MIKEKNLRDSRSYAFRNGEKIHLDMVAEGLATLADSYGVKIAFAKDQVKFGDLLDNTVENCIVLFHPEHRNDYISTVFRVKHLGRYAFMYLDDMGVSKNFKNARISREDRHAATSGESLLFKITYGIATDLREAGANRAKLEEEQCWYSIVEDIISEFCNG